MHIDKILNLPMQENDAEAKTIRDYLKELLKELWVEGEGFSGKRPFGNSGWHHELYTTLIIHKVIDGTLDEDGYIDHCDDAQGDTIIIAVINAL